MPIRVLIADDNILFREGLASLLGRQAELDVIGQAGDTREVIHKAALLKPDVVLLDHTLLGSVEGVRRIAAERPQKPVCLLTTDEQAPGLFQAVRAGAMGCMPKDATLAEVCLGLEDLAAGGAVVRPPLAWYLLAEFADSGGGVPRSRPSGDSLTRRELEVLTLRSLGGSAADTAINLKIHENTVKVHLRNVLDKLHARGPSDDDAGMQGAGVPRRPTPGGFSARTEAVPNIDIVEWHPR